jgi:hypothetical protein
MLPVQGATHMPVHDHRCPPAEPPEPSGEPPEPVPPMRDLCVYEAVDPDAVVVDLSFECEREQGYDRFGRKPGKRSRAKQATNKKRT